MLCPNFRVQHLRLKGRASCLIVFSWGLNEFVDYEWIFNDVFSNQTTDRRTTGKWSSRKYLEGSVIMDVSSLDLPEETVRGHEQIAVTKLDVPAEIRTYKLPKTSSLESYTWIRLSCVWASRTGPLRLDKYVDQTFLLWTFRYRPNSVDKALLCTFLTGPKFL
jgi:hypothetical protein